MTDTNALSLARIGRLLNWIGLALAVVAALGLAAWLTGCVVSDRYYWSQFLAWIPTPYALGLAALGCLGAARRGGSPRGRRRRLTVWITATMILGGYFTVIEHRMLARPPAAPTGLRLTHWTMSHSMRESDDHARRIAELAGDITVLSDASNITWNRVAEFIDDPSLRTLHLGRFWILSGLPILEARTIVQNQGAEIAFVTFDASEALGFPITIYLVDLPSDPRVDRHEQALRVRRWMDSSAVPPPDLALGDFNTPRGSHSLSVLFPGLHHAYDEGGRGYAASFRRIRPLFHIDHVLIGESLSAPAYRLIDPGLGRHRVQQAVIAPAGARS